MKWGATGESDCIFCTASKMVLDADAAFALGCLRESQDTTVPEVLQKGDVSLELIHFVPQGLDVPEDHGG